MIYTIANIYAHKIGTPWYKKEILKEHKEENNIFKGVNIELIDVEQLIPQNNDMK